MFKKYKNKKYYRFFYYLISGTALVIFWRGTWGLLDMYLFPDNDLLSYSVSILVGLLILWINDFSLSELVDTE